MILRSQPIKIGLSLGLLFGLWSCGGSSSSEDKSPCAGANAIVAEANYSSLWANVFSGRCGSCHGASVAGTENGPDMRTKELFHANVVSKSTSDYPEWEFANNNLEGCLTTPFINPRSAAQSVVVATLDSSVTLSGCTPKPHKDPPQSVCISNGSLASLKKWIDSGALK